MKGLLIISGLGILAMLAEIFKFKKLLLPIVLLGIISAFALNFLEWQTRLDISYFENMISFDKLAIAFSGIILLTAFFWFILANNYFDKSSSLVDHFALVLFALVGALMLTAFKNMTTLFLGIEIMSIPLYVLAASKKEDLKSNEAGFKYLIMGSFASGFLLFGITLIYGACGTFDIMKMRMFIEHNASQLPLFFYVGVVLILIALLFKVSAAPFHFWAPDVYEGSPTLITALMSTIVKTAAFAAIFRLFSIGFGSISEVWTSALALIIAASLIIANFSAAMQSNVKRMLAFSSISHAGFMLMVILANIRTNISLDAIIYYSLAYSIGSISAFGILYNVSRKGNEDISAFNGLSKNNPLIALCMTLSMFSLAGIPITAGFFAKYFVFTTLIGTPNKWLLILAIITSAIGA
ncbi:MAG: NADH-quinone oxidoreductase subunit N, partial [Sphingobacteriia bacterium]|nr:NADH-quinone oxidoreductase subunit N [Candidatus Fonsibacter lacus]